MTLTMPKEVKLFDGIIAILIVLVTSFASFQIVSPGYRQSQSRSRRSQTQIRIRQTGNDFFERRRKMGRETTRHPIGN